MALDFGTPAQPKGQRADRESVTYYDDHDRPYEVTIQKRNLSPVSIPIALFEAPFYVPTQYLTPKRDPRRGTIILGRFQIDYESWIAEIRDNHSMYRSNLRALCEKFTPNQVTEALQHPERFPQIIELAGYPPLSENFVRALRVGNPWATGAIDGDPSDLVNARGERIFSDEDVRSLEAYVRKHEPLVGELAEDTELFGLGGDNSVAQAQAAHPDDAAAFSAPAGAPRTPRLRTKKGRVTAEA